MFPLPGGDKFGWTGKPNSEGLDWCELRVRRIRSSRLAGSSPDDMLGRPVRLSDELF